MKRSLFVGVLAWVLFASFAVKPARAQNDSWNDSANNAIGAWENAANWNLATSPVTNVVPTSTNPAVFEAGGTDNYTVTINSDSDTASEIYYAGPGLTVDLQDNTLDLGNITAIGTYSSDVNHITFDGGTSGTAGGGSIDSTGTMGIDNNIAASSTSGVTVTFQDGANFVSVPAAGQTALNVAIIIGGYNSTVTGTTLGSNDALQIESGSTADALYLYLGYGVAGNTGADGGTPEPNYNNTVLVTGAGSQLNILSGTGLKIGTPGSNVSYGNVLTVTNQGSFAINAPTAGTSTINYGGSTAANGITVSNGGTATFGTASVVQNLTNGGTITASGGLLGAGTLTVYGTLTNGNQVVVSGGTLNVDGGMANGAAGGTVSFASGNVNLNGGAATNDFTTGLKAGDGMSSAKAVLTISGTGTQFGTTAATGLTLAANNGEVTGTGTASGLVTSNAGSIIAPGAIGTGAGTLTLNSLNLTNGATLNYDLGASATQLLAVTSITNSSATPNLTFNLNNLAATVNTTYNLITWTTNTGLTALDCINSPTDGVTGTFDILNNDELQFTVLTVPEPNTGALFLVGSVALLFCASRAMFRGAHQGRR